MTRPPQTTPPSPARSDDASLSHAFSSSDGRTASRWFRAQHFQRVWETLDPGNIEMRPPHPYTELIKLCILKRREGKLTLSQLYRDLEDKFPFFATSHKGKGWKVSVIVPYQVEGGKQSLLTVVLCSPHPIRTRCDTICPHSPTSSSSTANTVSWARDTIGPIVLTSRSPHRSPKARSCRCRRCGLLLPARLPLSLERTWLANGQSISVHRGATTGTSGYLRSRGTFVRSRMGTRRVAAIRRLPSSRPS